MTDIKIEIYSKSWCPFCVRAKALLKEKGAQFKEIEVLSCHISEEMIKRAGRRTVPQIFINGQGIGGYDDLIYLNSTGQLDQLLGTPKT